MAFLVGSGCSDYLDLIGQTEDTTLIDAILRAALRAEPDLVGFRFYHVPATSRTGAQLRAIADTLGLTCVDEGELVAPALMSSAGTEIRQAADRRSLVKHERFFQRDGILKIQHWRHADAVIPHLSSFFEQHIRRWEATRYPSLFLDSAQQSFYRLLVDQAGPAGWLRFTRIAYNGDPIAFHFGFSHAGRFLYYTPSFAIEWAKRSPGQVLLRQLFLAAEAEDTHIFDFGLGDEAYKHKFANHIQRVQTWGLYPKPGRRTT
jgi:CelD/BcsL family acetyltransferase involved in cellulose biosynthesis